ncbi:MAG: hypothetical protein FWG64_05660 [Firmicutes bacterium]|nr:hypothetical protein [Bacillota bacterium]
MKKIFLKNSAVNVILPIDNILSLASIMLFIATSLIYHNVRYYFATEIGILAIGFLYFLISAIFLYFALNRKLQSFDYKITKNLTKFVIITNGIIFIFAITAFLIFHTNISIVLSTWAIHNAPIITNATSEIRLLLLFATIFIGILAIRGIFNGLAENFITLLHCVIFAVYLQTIGTIHGILTDISQYFSKLTTAGILYLFSITFAMIIFKYLQKNWQLKSE